MKRAKNDDIQLVFASFVQKFVIVGLILLVAGFGIYVFEVLKPNVAPREVTQLWHLDARELLERTKTEDGWGWIKNITAGDALSLATLVFLPCATVVCLILILPFYIRQKKMVYSIIVAAEIGILIIAASGIIAA